MSRIISIQNSGESLEKCIALFYTARKSATEFYSDNEFYIFYGHNLPKKDNSINVHGTVGFYTKYFSKYEWCPIKSENDLFNMREMFLKKLHQEGIITKRNIDMLYKKDNLYFEFIKNIPIGMLFPDFISHIKECIRIIMPNVRFEELFLEKNYMKYFSSLPDDKSAYSIYALNITGTIGHYYLNDFGSDNNYYYRNLFHMFKDLSQKPVLSGNSALFLAEIQDVTRNMDYYIGYRNHSREIRMNREFALSELLKNKKKIIEPKNNVLSQYFDKFITQNEGSMEKLANSVIAKVYEDFINEYDIFKK